MKYKLFLLVIFIACMHHFCAAQQKLKVVLAGLSHDHVNPILDKYKSGQIEIIGIAETSLPLCEKKKKAYQLPDSIFFKDLKTALQSKHPDLVMVFAL